MSSSANTWGVIVAAGRGERFGSDGPKQFTSVAGKPLVLWAIEAFHEHPAVAGVSVVLPRRFAEEPPAWLSDLAAEGGVVLVAGGAERTDSVRAGLAAASDEVELIAVHDGARPLITRALITKVAEAAGPNRGAIAARPVTDTLKAANDDGTISRTVERGTLWRAETPQAFGREVMIDVYRKAEAEGLVATDSAGLCERYGVPVVLVEVEGPNLKVTRPEDIELAEALLKARRR